LAVGLALQGSLSNFAAGVMMIIFQPFRIGDYVEAGGAEGTVSEIQIFSTIIMSKDNKRVIVPNAKITGDKIMVHLKNDFANKRGEL
jgi:small conductance mechanosensitive channel